MIMSDILKIVYTIGKITEMTKYTMYPIYSMYSMTAMTVMTAMTSHTWRSMTKNAQHSSTITPVKYYRRSNVYSTVQYSTVQYSNVYSTAQCNNNAQCNKTYGLSNIGY